MCDEYGDGEKEIIGCGCSNFLRWWRWLFHDGNDEWERGGRWLLLDCGLIDYLIKNDELRDF